MQQLTQSELLEFLRNEAIKLLHSICQQFGKLSSGHSVGKGQFSTNPKERHFQRMFNLS